MTAISPLDGLIVHQDWMERVISPAYDALSVDARVRFRQENPHSYLHVTRSASDEPDGDDIDDRTLVTRGRAALDALLAANAFTAMNKPCFLVYELADDGHTQRGLVVEFDPQAFVERVLPHEQVQAERAALLTLHAQVVQAVSSPVALTVDDDGSLAHALNTIAAGPPDRDFVASDGLRQRIWQVTDDEQTEAIQQAVAQPSFYIVDGHHRAAANRALLDAGTPVPVLAVIFPKTELRIDGFHRLLRLPEGVTEADLLAHIRRRFPVTSATDIEPEPGHVSVKIAGGWHTITFDERPVAGSALVRRGSLDPVVLQREILDTLAAAVGQPLNVTYLPATAGVAELERVAEIERRVPFSVAAVDLDDLIAVADGRLTLPPKSTYFTPKVRSGVFLRTFDH